MVRGRGGGAESISPGIHEKEAGVYLWWQEKKKKSGVRHSESRAVLLSRFPVNHPDKTMTIMFSACVSSTLWPRAGWRPIIR